MSPSVGRVLTWSPPREAMPTKSSSASSSSRGVWVVTGQCVCVVHPRIVLTAAHVCFAKRTRHIIRVLHTPVDGKPLQHFEAQLLRYSGVMDLAVLLLDAPVDSSPFQPCFIAPAHNPLFDYLQKVALFCYPLTMDVQPGASDSVVLPRASSLVHHPHCLSGDISCILPQKQPSKKTGETRGFSNVTCTYTAFRGCSGGGVFAHDVVAQRWVLLGVHTSAVSHTSSTSVSIEDLEQYDGPKPLSTTDDDAASRQGVRGGEEEEEGRASASKRQRGEASPTAPPLTAPPPTSTPHPPSTATPAGHTAVTEPSPSSTPEDSPVKAQRQAKLAEEVSHKSMISVFVAVDSVLSQQVGWGEEALLLEAAATPPSSAAAPSRADIDVQLVKVEQETPHRTSPRFLGSPRAVQQPYGDGHEDAVGN